MRWADGRCWERRLLLRVVGLQSAGHPTDRVAHPLRTQRVGAR